MKADWSNYFIEEMRRSLGKQSSLVAESAAPLRPSITKFGANAITIKFDCKSNKSLIYQKNLQKRGLTTIGVARGGRGTGAPLSKYHQ